MNKQELIARIVKETRVSKALASRMVAATLGAITKSLKKGDAVTLVGFGTFKPTVRKARKGRNPSTGESLKLPATKVPKFVAGSAFKAAVDPKAAARKAAKGADARPAQKGTRAAKSVARTPSGRATRKTT